MSYYRKTQFSKYHIFTSPLNQWCSKEVYKQEMSELNKQIKKLLSLQGALGQSSQGHPEDTEQRILLENEVNQLKFSICHALQLYERPNV